MLAAPVHPKSNAGREIPVFKANASEAGDTAFDIKPIIIPIPVNATPKVIAEIKAFLTFIPTNKPRTKMISGTKMADPKSKIHWMTF